MPTSQSSADLSTSADVREITAANHCHAAQPAESRAIRGQCRHGALARLSPSSCTAGAELLRQRQNPAVAVIVDGEHEHEHVGVVDGERQLAAHRHRSKNRAAALRRSAARDDDDEQRNRIVATCVCDLGY